MSVTEAWKKTAFPYIFSALYFKYFNPASCLPAGAREIYICPQCIIWLLGNEDRQGYFLLRHQTMATEDDGILGQNLLLFSWYWKKIFPAFTQLFRKNLIVRYGVIRVPLTKFSVLTGSVNSLRFTNALLLKTMVATWVTCLIFHILLSLLSSVMIFLALCWMFWVS